MTLSTVLVLLMGLSVIVYAYRKDFHDKDKNDRDMGDY
jgi:hypothetical protein